jgi:hypothetical protein
MAKHHSNQGRNTMTTQANRISRHGSEPPTLHFINQADQVEIQLAFGYFKNEPTVALFHNDTLVLIPKDVLQIAFKQGWS